MKLIKRVMGLFVVMFAFASTAMAEDEVRIVIDEGVDGARPIAVVPFAGSAPENIGQIVADDLRNSGKFNPIPVSQMPQQPTTAAEVKPEAWTALGIDAVVVGQVTSTGSGYNISYQLVDTVGASLSTRTCLVAGSGACHVLPHRTNAIVFLLVIIEVFRAEWIRYILWTVLYMEAVVFYIGSGAVQLHKLIILLRAITGVCHFR